MAIFDTETGGPFSLAVGYVKGFTFIQWVTLPFAFLSIYRWEGDAWLMVLWPLLAVLLVGLALIGWSTARQGLRLGPARWLGALAGLLCLGTAGIVLFRGDQGAVPDGVHERGSHHAGVRRGAGDRRDALAGSGLEHQDGRIRRQEHAGTACWPRDPRAGGTGVAGRVCRGADHGSAGRAGAGGTAAARALTGRPHVRYRLGTTSSPSTSSRSSHHLSSRASFRSP